MIGKLYTNALMVLMNSRQKHLTSRNVISYVWSEDNEKSDDLQAANHAPISVEINVQRETQSDDVAMVTFNVSGVVFLLFRFYRS
jgi:hypothetical protein